MGQRKAPVRMLSAILAAAWPCLLRAQEAAPVTAPAPTPLFYLVESVQADVTRLSAILNDETAKQDDRDEAARRLEARALPATRQILRDALISAGNPGAQLAAARALAGGDRPDDDFRDPLFALIGRSRLPTEAAATALAGYKGDVQVMLRLSDIAKGPAAESTRLPVIRAVGMFVDKRAAATLVEILARPDESNDIHAAAADALIYMTGMRGHGRSLPKWQQWWAESAPLDETQWRIRLLDNRAARLDHLQLLHDQLSAEVEALINEQFQLADPDQRAALSLRLLHSPSPAIRAQGAARVYADMVQGQPVAQSVQQQVRAMIGDSDPQVRIAIAQALFAMVDTASVDALLVQLEQETDSEVKIALARTLAKIGEPRAIEPLQKLLADDSMRVAEAAADALKEFGRTLRDRDPARATAMSLQLRDLLDQGGRRAETPRFREAIVEAMAAMREPQLGQMFLKLVRRNESVGVRRAALRGMGALRDRNFADAIFAQLDDADAGIRTEAAGALQFTASPADVVRLLARLDPKAEINESVRNTVWRAIEGLLPEMTPEQLKNLADRFPDDPTRRATIQEKRRDLLVLDKRPEDLAFARQDLGNTYLELAQPEKAAVELQAALEYWRSRGQEMMADQLVAQLLGALLKAEKHTDAAAFAAGMIATKTGFQDVVGPMIRDEAERLVQAGQEKNALSLIAAVEKMDPPLARRFTAPLEALKQKATEQPGG